MYTQGLNRIPPSGPPSAYKTYQIKQPVQTHYRPASCEEVQCADYLGGWKVILDGVLVTAQLEHAARTSGRHFHEVTEENGTRALVFEAGQPCFRAGTHRVSLEREALFIRRNGDFRTPRSATTRFKRAEDWRDDFGEHQDRIAEQVNRG